VKKALITGITGQDGLYLTELLLAKGYEVHGIVKKNSEISITRIEYLFRNIEIGNKLLFLHQGDLTDSTDLERLIKNIRPDEIYNLAAQSHVATSFDIPEYTAEVTGIATLRLLESIRKLGLSCKFYQASTSELFGGLPKTAPQNEKTPFYPKSPYGVAKLYAYWITVNYRESYNMFACNGILFNHESPRRGDTFITRKITRAVASIIANKQDKLSLGNLNVKRDWGFAGDYVKGMWLMLQQDKPDDYVLASNEAHTVREFVELSFKEVGIEIEWNDSGLEEKGYNKKTGDLLVDINPKYFRPAEVNLVHGNCNKAEKELGWKREVDFLGLISMMVNSDMIEIAGISTKDYLSKEEVAIE